MKIKSYRSNILKPLIMDEFNAKIDRAEDDAKHGRVMTTEQIKKTLDKRIEKIESGKVTFKPWSEVQAKYKRRKL